MGGLTGRHGEKSAGAERSEAAIVSGIGGRAPSRSNCASRLRKGNYFPGFIELRLMEEKPLFERPAAAREGGAIHANGARGTRPTRPVSRANVGQRELGRSPSGDPSESTGTRNGPHENGR